MNKVGLISRFVVESVLVVLFVSNENIKMLSLFVKFLTGPSDCWYLLKLKMSKLSNGCTQ